MMMTMMVVVVAVLVVDDDDDARKRLQLRLYCLSLRVEKIDPGYRKKNRK